MRGENFLERKLFSPHPFFKELYCEKFKLHCALIGYIYFICKKAYTVQKSSCAKIFLQYNCKKLQFRYLHKIKFVVY